MNKLVNLLNRVLNNNGVKLKKQDEYMYWSPFVTHHKRKLQVNGIVGYLMLVVETFFSYSKRYPQQRNNLMNL